MRVAFKVACRLALANRLWSTTYGRVQKKLTFRNRDYPVLREKIVKSAYLNSYYFVLLRSVKRSVVLRPQYLRLYYASYYMYTRLGVHKL